MDNNITNNNLNIIATPIEGKNYVHLEWNNVGEGYSYTIYEKGENEEVFQSIPSKTNVKVLNVYPDKGNNLKTWMETNGYGKGIIAVDEVSISVFNNSPTDYLGTNRNWKYDVVMFGSWDSNNEKDLNSLSEPIVESFMDSGRGVLIGHDAINGPYFNKLAGKMKVSTSEYKNYNGIESDSDGIGPLSYDLHSKIQVAKKGLLTNYPWNIGDIGTILTIPSCHSSQSGYGDIWMRYYHPAYTSDDMSNPANEYLQTWNNTAIIMTGHASGQATEDEQKILANTLYYLAQLTNNTSCDDHKGQDLTAPNKVSIISVSDDAKNLNVTYSKTNDNGTKYDYYVKATDGNAGNDITSNTVSITNTSGIAGYSYVVDNIENTEPDNKIMTTDLSISVPLSGLDLFKPIYVHIKAIDNAGNASETTHYEYKYITSLSLDKSSVNLNTGDTQTVIATTTPAGMQVTWTSSDSSVVTVDSNGNVTGVKEGQATITANTVQGNLSETCIVTVIEKPTQLVNTAYAKGDNTNTSSGDVPTIFNGLAETTLSVVKTSDAKIVCVGDTFTYTIVVTNTGSKTAQKVVIKDNAPKHIKFTTGGIITTQGEVDSSSTSSNIVVNVGDISPSGTVTITIPATVVI